MKNLTQIIRSRSIEIALVFSFLIGICTLNFVQGQPDPCGLDLEGVMNTARYDDFESGFRVQHM